MSLSVPAATRRATLADLARTPAKAELIGGRIVLLMPTGHRPNRVAGRIYRSLDDHATATGRGFAYTDNMGYAVPELPSGRESFAPDASYYLGPPPGDDMDFVDGPPTLAVEVRSKNDYGDAAEEDLAAKRADYFIAGTLVVWDVDPRARCIHAYRRDSPGEPITFGPGGEADAGAAVPGWRIRLEDVFAP